MDQIQYLTELGSSGWQITIVTVVIVLFFSVALIKALQFLASVFGWESKTERRFKDMENEINTINNEITKNNKSISDVWEQCKNAISDTETKFDDREREHWGESKVIRDDYDNRILNLDSKLDKIINQLDKRESLDFKKLRNQIIQLGEDAIERGSITIRKLKSLEELHSEYTEKYGGNSYVTTLMHKVRDITVIGRLNEHGEDIE